MVKKTEYEEHYFTRGSYTPYRDFENHAVRARRIVWLTNPKTLLDVGCAYGFLVGRLLVKGVDAWGCDISRWCQTQAEKIIPGRFVLCPATKLDFPDKKFDVVYSEGVLEHLEEPEVLQALKEMERVGRRRILAVTFTSPGTQGHQCNQDVDWWYERIPRDTYLYTGAGDSSGGDPWWLKRKDGSKEVIRC